MTIEMSRDAQLIDAVHAGQRAINSAEAAKFVHLLEFVDLRRAEGETRGGRRFGDGEVHGAMFELSLALMLPVATVQTQAAAARSLRARMPDVWSAWLRGEITARAAFAIDAAGDRLTRDESRARLDAGAVAAAVAKTPAQLWSWLNRFVERWEADSARARQRRAFADRAVWKWTEVDGMAKLTALISVTDAAAIDALLDTRARSLGSADERSMDQRRADLLTDTLLGRTADEGAPGRVAATIGVIVPIQSLVGMSDLPGEFADRSDSIPADMVRSLAARPGTLFWRLLTDSRGHLLDATELGRFASAKLGFAVRLRDGTSVFPTSSVPASRCDLDHTFAHCGHQQCTEYGPTTGANLGPLDRRVHQQKTDGNLLLRQPRPGTFEWTTRTGHRYTHEPDPLPVAEWDNPFGFPSDVPVEDQYFCSNDAPDELPADRLEQQAIRRMWEQAA